MNDRAGLDYEKLYSTFEWDRPVKYNFARDVIDKWARTPDKLAMIFFGDNDHIVRRTFRDVSAASQRLCNVLTKYGIERGDSVVIILPRRYEWWDIVTACLRMGAVASPGTAQLSARDIAFRINAIKATCVITDAAGAEKVNKAVSECPSVRMRLNIDSQRKNYIDYHAELAAADEYFETVDTLAKEDAICYFTSGTTGYPKMCMHSHDYAIGHRTTGKYWLDLTPKDLHWNISDTGWAKAAWSSYFGPWNSGAGLLVYNSEGFSASKILEILQEYPVTTMCGAPTIFRMLVQEDLSAYRFPKLRHAVAAGEPLNPEVIDHWKEATGIDIRDGYGQTETALLCGSFPFIKIRPGSMGKPAPGIELAIIDDKGRILQPGQEGDIAVNVGRQPPPGFFKEYRGDVENPHGVRVGEWYLTGDRGMRDEEGYFWFVGRADDVILSSGYRIGPFEVESALLEHPAVAESAVVSSPDDTRGEVVKAFIVLARGFDPSDELKKDLQEYVKSVTAFYKYPRRIEFIEELPKTVSGKIRRVDLRDQEWSNVKRQ